MEYEVTVDFHDNAVHAPKVCANLTELALYLERVPSMIGFEIHGSATVSVRPYSQGIPAPMLFT